MVTRREYIDLLMDSLDIVSDIRQADPTKTEHPDDIFYDLERHLQTFHATYMAAEVSESTRRKSA